MKNLLSTALVMSAGFYGLRAASDAALAKELAALRTQVAVLQATVEREASRRAITETGSLAEKIFDAIDGFATPAAINRIIEKNGGYAVLQKEDRNFLCTKLNRRGSYKSKSLAQQELDMDFLRAAKSEDLHLVRKLLGVDADGNRADVNAIGALAYSPSPDALCGEPAIFSAIRKKNNALVEELVLAGANVNARIYSITPAGDVSCNTPLSIAVGWGNTRAVKYLVGEAGAEISVVLDLLGSDVVSAARKFGPPEITEYLESVITGASPSGVSAEVELSRLLHFRNAEVLMAALDKYAVVNPDGEIDILADLMELAIKRKFNDMVEFLRARERHLEGMVSASSAKRVRT